MSVVDNKGYIEEDEGRYADQFHEKDIVRPGGQDIEQARCRGLTVDH